MFKIGKRMKKIRLFLFVLLLVSQNRLFAQNASVIKWQEMENILTDSTDRLHVINFWATWCSPCVKELPFFEQLHQQNPNIKVTLVSLDFVKEYQKRLLGFLERKQIGAKVVLLDETDYNSWIDKVEPSWQGEIPFTLIFNHKKNIRRAVMGELSSEELQKIIDILLKH